MTEGPEMPQFCYDVYDAPEVEKFIRSSITELMR
jgi:hypothetical protein